MRIGTSTLLHFLAICLAVSSLGTSGCPSDPDPSGDDGDVSQAILDMEEETLGQVNLERTSRGLDALVMRTNVRRVARAHSQDMVDRGFFSHTNPDGDGLAERLADGGVTYRTAGENIAWNNYADPITTAVEGWMASSGHRANILREEFSDSGVGIATDGSGTYYFTQVFIGWSKSVPEGFVEIYCYPPESAPE